MMGESQKWLWASPRVSSRDREVLSLRGQVTHTDLKYTYTHCGMTWILWLYKIYLMPDTSQIQEKKHQNRPKHEKKNSEWRTKTAINVHFSWLSLNINLYIYSFFEVIRCCYLKIGFTTIFFPSPYMRRITFQIWIFELLPSERAENVR